MRRKNRKRQKVKSVDSEQAEYTVEIKRFLEVRMSVNITLSHNFSEQIRIHFKHDCDVLYQLH